MLLRITLHIFKPHWKFTQFALHRRHYLCRHIGVSPLIFITILLFIVSYHLLPRTNPSPHSSSDATTSKICTTYTSRITHAFPSQVYPRQPTTLRVAGLATQVSAIHFMPNALRWVRFNAFLSGCQPPWPPPHCLNRAQAFALCLALGRSSRSQVHPSLRSMLTTDRPLAHFRLKRHHYPTRLYTHVRSLLAAPTSSLPHAPHMCRCPERHFGWNQLPDSSFGLSPLCTCHTIELHIRMVYVFQRLFHRLQRAHT